MLFHPIQSNLHPCLTICVFPIAPAPKNPLCFGKGQRLCCGESSESERSKRQQSAHARESPGGWQIGYGVAVANGFGGFWRFPCSMVRFYGMLNQLACWDILKGRTRYKKYFTTGIKRVLQSRVVELESHQRIHCCCVATGDTIDCVGGMESRFKSDGLCQMFEMPLCRLNNVAIKLPGLVN